MKLRNFATSILQQQLRILSLISKNRAAKRAFDIFCTPNSKRKYILSPFFNDAEKLEFISNGKNMRGYRWNKGGTKKILIAHGFQSIAANFEHIIKKFVHKGYEVVAFDAPAHGYSDGKKITSLLYRDLIKEANDRYGSFHRYLGHSFGCMGTCFALAETPVQEDVKVVLIAPASNLISISEMFFAQMKIKDKDLQRTFYEYIEKVSNLKTEWYDVKRCLQTFHYPVLWIQDKKDRITPVKDALHIQKLKFPYIQFIFTEGLGHRKIYRDKDVVNTILDFL
jgi:pimeloyl-ACP methyl ester carboxylesterase